MKANAASNCWKQFTLLANFSEDLPPEELATKLGLPRMELTKLLVGIQDAKTLLEAETGQSEEVFQVWNWAEWCQMVHAMEELARDKADTGVTALLTPFLKQCRLHPAYRVYVKLRQSWEALSSAPDVGANPRASIVEEAILHGWGLRYLQAGKTFTLLPTKLVHLEGSLSVVGEEPHDHGLLAVPLAEMGDLETVPHARPLRAHALEVEEFIHALRAMGDRETRLVLKIKDPSRFTLLPDYHHLGRPCLVTNADGDLIWAAWVEPCDELYGWLAGLADQVEILDPVDFMADYIAWCERKTA